MGKDINTAARPESAEIQKGQQQLAAFIQTAYVEKKDPDERLIDIRDDGENGCSSVIYFNQSFADHCIRMVAKEKLIIAMIDEPTLDWVAAMPWEHAVWVTGKQNALQIHCAPIEMSNGDTSDVFAIQIPATPDFVSKARHLMEGTLVRFSQDKDTGSIKVTGSTKLEFPVTDIS